MVGAGQSLPESAFPFEHSNFVLVSDFDIRASDLAADRCRYFCLAYYLLLIPVRCVDGRAVHAGLNSTITSCRIEYRRLSGALPRSTERKEFITPTFTRKRSEAAIAPQPEKAANTGEPAKVVPAAASTATLQPEKPKRSPSLKVAPKFKRGDIVLLSLMDENGMPKNDLAREAAEYYSQSAEIITLSVASDEGKEVFVYGVQTDDGNFLELPETCLMALLSF